MAKNIVVCTGHRKVVEAHVPVIRASVRAAVREADEMVFGGAAGFDLIALWEAMMWKAFARNPQHREYAKVRYPKAADCKIVVVVCKTRKEQPYVCVDAFDYFEKSQPGVIEYVELGLEYKGENLLKRNRVMVDRIPRPADGSVLAYFDRKTFKSGTYHCMQYAESKNVNVFNICPVEEPVTKKASPEPKGPDEHPF